ncbi:hypothetical protein [Streptomyces sp. Y7]|uniref:hypothetical protein n=1 Tax=Streptomyces sp. Y7 TaxID=3342392 RepID=UPI0037117320
MAALYFDALRMPWVVRPWLSLSWDAAIRAAAARVSIPVPAAVNLPARTLCWGAQVDVQPIFRVGRHLRFDPEDVRVWVESHMERAA